MGAASTWLSSSQASREYRRSTVLPSIIAAGSLVGWVEPTPGFVGFRCTQTNLHFAEVFANCETQQRPISNRAPKISFSIKLAAFQASGGLETSIFEPSTVEPLRSLNGKT